MNRCRKSTAYWVSLAMVIVFFVGLAIYLTTITPAVQGDGHEYIMQTVAFQNHFSFGISPEDFEEAKTEFYNNQEGLHNSYTHPVNMIRDERGWAYSNHFGAYSAMVTIVKLALLKLNIYPLWAFSITNLILWMAAILVVFFFLKTDDKRRFCVLILLMLNPVFFYLDWVHTEMYIFAFEVIGLVFLYNKQYARSILALSVSAMQNVGVLPMAAIAGIAYILDCYNKYASESHDRNVGKFILTYWKKIVPYGFLYLPAFCPIITTYLRFGVFNRVAAVAMENKYLLHKAIDYLFDPNLGIFPYEPIILIAFIVLIVLGIRRFPQDAILNLLGVVGILFIISHQRQINSGMQEIMRYCVWIIPVMIFYVVLHWQPSSKKRNGLIVATALECVFTTVMVGYCVWFDGAYTSCQFANWTKVLIDIAPQVYNPTHGIFYSRTSGIESYHWPIPVVYTNDHGYVRKILLSKEAEETFYDDSFLIDGQGNLIDKNTLKGYKVDEGDYTYFNFNGKTKWLESRLKKVVLGDTLDTIYFYSDHYNADTYVQKGLSAKEYWGTWTDGQEVVLCFALTDTCTPFIGVSVDVCNTFYHPQSVTALVNGVEVYQDTIEGDADIEFVFENPETDIIELTFLLPDAVAPSEIMESNDQRELGLGLLTMKLVEINPDPEISRIPDDGIVRLNGVDYIGNLYIIEGISLPDKDATWTLGKKMLALFNVDDNTAAETIHVSMDLEDVVGGQQDVSISINGTNVFRDTVTAGENAISFDIPNPEDGNIFMAVDIPDAVSLLQLGISDDPRELGLMIKNIKFIVE